MSGAPAATGASPPPPPAGGPVDVATIPTMNVGKDAGIDVGLLNSLPPAAKKMVMANIERYEANPNPGTKRALEQALAQVVGAPTAAAPTQPPTGTAPPTVVEGLTPRKDAYREKFNEKTAETLEKALTSSNQTYSESAGMLAEINNLEGLFKRGDIPEGEFAPLFTKIGSGLASFGVKTGDATGPAQAAIAASNAFALKLRTGGDQNLMPGAMSNFDAQLLQSMAPSLSQTQEGRLYLLQMMRSMAESNMRIAEEAQNFASANGGILTPEWRQHALKMAHKEMAKRELMRRQAMKLFGGPQQ